MRSKVDNAEAEHGSQAGRCNQQRNAGDACPHGSDWFEIRVRHEYLDPARRRPALT
jgi:hypothetical protein